MGYVLKFIDNTVKAIVIVCSMAMTISVLIGIFFRYVVHSSLPWTEELPRFLMIWTAIWGGALALDYGYLVSFNAVVNRFGSSVRFCIFLFTRALIMVFLSVLVYKGFSLMSMFSFQKAPTLQISYAIPYACVPLASVFFLMKYLIEFFGEIKKRFNMS